MNSSHTQNPPKSGRLSLPALLATFLALAALAGCASAPNNSWGPSPRKYQEPFSAPSSEGLKAPTTAVPTDGDWSKAPSRQRPGLATAFGENRPSTIARTRFKRDGRDPMLQLTMHYNDRSGLDVLMNRQYAAPKMTNGPMSAHRGDFAYGLRGEAGQWLPTWVASGWTFVEGKPGERYLIIVMNQSPLRREVVISVDGLDVMDGQSASTKKRGYILDPGQEFAVEGFRTGPDTVAAFRFGSVAESYSNQRHGTTRNIGVIGLAVFEESNLEADRRIEADAFPATWATPPRR